MSDYSSDLFYFAAGDNHVDTSEHLLHSLLSELARMAFCHWSCRRMYVGVPPCQAHIKVSNQSSIENCIQPRSAAFHRSKLSVQVD